MFFGGDCNSGAAGKELPSYEYGTVIRFGQGGNSEPYQISGWSMPEDGFTWTEGKRAVLGMDTRAGSFNLVLKAELFPFVVSGTLEQQRVIVYVNGNKLGEWVARMPGTFVMHIPARYTSKGLREVVLELPDAAVVKTVRPDSQDGRMLSIGVQKITIEGLRR